MSTAVASENTLMIGALESRYRDAYAVANGIVLAGNAIKFAAIAIAVIIIFCGFTSDGLGTGILIAMGILVGVAGFAAGILVSAQGQIMQSVIDTAVNTSPQISSEQKVQVMGLL